MRKVHVISGLPRSGSTLLSAILRQNPRFEAGVTSPVASLCDALTRVMSAGAEFGSCFDDARRASMFHAVFAGYYASVAADKVVFDTNRTWTAKLSWLGRIYPDARVICCVRDIAWIIDSVERLLKDNPMQQSRVFGDDTPLSMYARVALLMNTDSGLVGLPWGLFREAWFGEGAERLIVVPYESLVAAPGKVIARLYEALEEPDFSHDFGNVSFAEPAYDVELGMPGLHRVRALVNPVQRAPSIPPDLFAKYADANFWRTPGLNVRNVRVL
jgi:sulfotransferase